jgi:anaerobic ribonucleoside-triphosphate reductase
MTAKNDFESLYQCPCCGNLTIAELGKYEICEVCGWEDDPVQSREPDYAGGANRISLEEARQKWFGKNG